MPSVQKALLKRGYVPVLIGGGITGDCQVNDTHFHNPLKANYRQLEQELMIEMLKIDKNKIPSPDRDDMMNMVRKAQKNITVDIAKGGLISEDIFNLVLSSKNVQNGYPNS